MKNKFFAGNTKLFGSLTAWQFTKNSKEPQRTRRQKHGKKALPEICQVTHQWKSSLNHTNAVLICELAVTAQRRATEVAAKRSQTIS